MNKLNTLLLWLGGLLVLFGLVLIIWKKRTSQSDQFEKAVRERVNPLIQRIVIAVAKHETGNYSSRLVKENNNFFGMKQPVRRNTYSIGADANGYAKFESPEKAVEDFTTYLSYVNFKPTDNVEEFVRQMKDKGYFEDTYENYLNGVKRWL